MILKLNFIDDVVKVFKLIVVIEDINLVVFNRMSNDNDINI